MSTEEIRVLQVSNISPTATRDQVYSLFSYIGRIAECKVYPSDTNTTQCTQKFAYIKFDKDKAVQCGQHLTNTVFIDRALTCVPALSNNIPDEETALQTGGPALPGQRQLPPTVTNQLQDIGDGQQMLFTVDPTFAQLGLPQYPPLPADTEPTKVEEIRRTIYVGNLDKEVDGDELMEFFNNTIGEVMYLRMTAGNENLPCAYAYIEFSNQSAVSLALQNNGIEFRGRPLRIQHSRVAIIKPQRKTADQALEEVEEAIKRDEGAEKRSGSIGRGYSPFTGGSSPTRSGSRRTPSPLRRASRERSERRRDRSRSRSAKRSRRSRSRDRKRSKSRDHDKRSKRSRSKSREKSRSRDRRSRSRDRKEAKKSSRDRDRRDKDRKERRRSRSRTPKKERKDRDKDRDRESKKSRRSPMEESPRQKKDKTINERSTRNRSETPPTPGRKNEEELEFTAKLPAKLEADEEETLRERLLEKVKGRTSSDVKEEAMDTTY
jgi:arginine/serine-rich splicing factor 12